MRDNIGAVSRVRGSDGDGGLLVAPGALNIDDRDRVTFYGNGTSTPAQVMARVIELDPALQLFHGNPHVAQYAAMTPADRIAMVAELSRSAYAFAEQGGADGRELSRHVERIVRGGR